MSIQYKLSKFALVLVFHLSFGLLQAQIDIKNKDFGTNGWVITDFGLVAPNTDYLGTGIKMPNDDIVLFGHSYPSYTKANFCLGIYEPNGKLKSGGKIVTPMSYTRDIGLTACLQNDGKILTGGYINPELSLNESPLVARYLANGQFDPSFQNVGRTTVYIYGDIQRLQYLHHTVDNKIVGIGYAHAAFPGDYDPFMFRLLDNGALDNTFVNYGKTQLAFSNDYEQVYGATKIKNGGYVMCGSVRTVTGKEKFWLGKVKDSGIIDQDFGINGSFKYPNESISQVCTAVEELSDGKILAGGYENINGKYELMILRLTDKGKHDPSFGTNGVWKHPTSISGLRISDILELGNYIYILSDFNGSFNLFRLLKTGQNDASFGNNGLIRIGCPNGTCVCGNLLVHQGDIIMTGTTKWDFAMCKVIPSLATSVEDTGEHPMMTKIYPNPIQSNTMLEVNAVSAHDIHVSIFDAQGGNAIMTNTYALNTGANKLDFHLEALPSGKYVITIQNEKGIIVDRIMIIKM